MTPGTLSARALLAIAIVALAVRLFALWAIPYAREPGGDPNFAPDEQAHLVEVQALAHGKLLHWPEQTSSIYAAFPPSNDAAQVATLWLGEHLGLDEFGERFTPLFSEGRGYPWARLGSALATMLAGLFFACAAARVSNDETSGLIVGLACALYPQLIFLGAYTNPDSLSICAAAALCAALARWWKHGEGERGILLVGAALGFVLATKLSGYYILPPAILWLLWPVYTRRIRLVRLAAAAAIALLIALPPMLLNGLRNHGDPLGTATYKSFLVTFWHPRTWTQLPNPFWLARRSLPASAYGLFGNMSRPLPAWEYVGFTILISAGLLCALVQIPRSSASKKRLIWFVLGTMVTNLVLELYNLFFVDFSPQGRYVLVSALFILIAALLAPRRLSPRLRAIPIAILFMLAVSTVTMERILYLHAR